MYAFCSNNAVNRYDARGQFDFEAYKAQAIANWPMGAPGTGVTYNVGFTVDSKTGIASATVWENGDYGSNLMSSWKVNINTGEEFDAYSGSSLNDIMNSGPALSQGGGPDAVDALNGEFDSMWAQNAAVNPASNQIATVTVGPLQVVPDSSSASNPGQAVDGVSTKDAPRSGAGLFNSFQAGSDGTVAFTPTGEVQRNYAGVGTVPAVQGTITTTNGFTVTAYQNTSGQPSCDYDCHGYTLTGGKLWVDNRDMQSFLAAQTYLARVDPKGSCCTSYLDR